MPIAARNGRRLKAKVPTVHGGAAGDRGLLAEEDRAIQDRSALGPHRSSEPLILLRLDEGELCSLPN